MTRQQVFKDFVNSLSNLSKCTERHVAAVVTDAAMTQVYSIGLNGGPKGLADCLCVTEGKYGCVHAEINALIKCRSDASDKVMFISLAPCKVCAAAIINTPGGFSAVYYTNSWKDASGIQLLMEAGIKVELI